MAIGSTGNLGLNIQAVSPESGLSCANRTLGENAISAAITMVIFFHKKAPQMRGFSLLLV